MTQLYRIEEMYSHGWDLIEEDAKQLTKEQCNQRLQNYIAVGYNPNYLRAVRES